MATDADLDPELELPMFSHIGAHRAQICASGNRLWGGKVHETVTGALFCLRKDASPPCASDKSVRSARAPQPASCVWICVTQTDASKKYVVSPCSTVRYALAMAA